MLSKNYFQTNVKCVHKLNFNHFGNIRYQVHNKCIKEWVINTYKL